MLLTGKTKFLFVSLFLFISSLDHPLSVPSRFATTLIDSIVNRKQNLNSYSDQSLEVHEIFPRIIILDADDDEEDLDGEYDDDEDEGVERFDLELDFHRITFN